jgi:hypothetical protein
LPRHVDSAVSVDVDVRKECDERCAVKQSNALKRREGEDQSGRRGRRRIKIFNNVSAVRVWLLLLGLSSSLHST